MAMGPRLRGSQSIAVVGGDQKRLPGRDGELSGRAGCVKQSPEGTKFVKLY